jgi:hypothetical protein
MARVVDDQLFDGAFDDADGAGEQLGPLGGGEDVGWGEADEVVGPLAHDLGVPDGARGATEHAELEPRGPFTYERCCLWETGLR